jgi:GH15 family glucan-1,4-alpha-glucosidase
MLASRSIAINDIQADYWRSMAKSIQNQTLDLLWMPEKNFFAQGLEHADNNSRKQIKTITSNGAAILDSNLLIDLPVDTKTKIIKSIIETISDQKQFLTPAGIRCRSLKNSNIPDFIDYHGSYTVWPKETFTITKGLRTHGFPFIAQEIEDLILQSILESGEFYEFFCVETDNLVWYDYNAEVIHFSGKSAGGDFELPETGQAWTVSAVTKILYERGIYNSVGAKPWETSIAKKISALKSQTIQEALLYS